MKKDQVKILLRVILDLALLLSIFIFPFWFTVLLSFAGLIYFDLFYEFIIVYFLIDLIYGLPATAFFNSKFILTIISIILFVGTGVLKKKLLLSKQ